VSRFVNNQFLNVSFTHGRVGDLPWSKGDVVRKFVCSIIGVKALTIGIVSVLLWDRAIVNERLNGSFFPTVKEVNVEVLVVSVALAIRANASAARLVLEVSTFVIQNTNEKLQLWESHREVTWTRTGDFTVGCVPHMIDMVVGVSKLNTIPTARHCKGNSNEIAITFWKM